MLKTGSGSQAFSIKINLAFSFFLILLYLNIVLHTLNLNHNEDGGVNHVHQKKKVEDDRLQGVMADEEERMVVKKKRKKPMMVLPSFLKGRTRIALVNVEAEQWPEVVDTVEEVRFDHVPANLTWKDFFPEWIDEEEYQVVPSCPEIPMPDFKEHGREVEVVVVELPYWEAGSVERDVFRLQVHLVAAKAAVTWGRRDGHGKVEIVFHSDRRPMIEIFRCDDLIKREGEWWMYQSEETRLKEKAALPVGSCKLALPLSRKGNVHSLPTYDPTPPNHRKHEAYATVIHSSDRYVCGAITLAQSLLRTGTDRDLVLLHDHSIPTNKLHALAAAGWKLRLISRIRNPHAKEDAYNAYNYSKLRLWQLVRYRKVVFIDADVLVLRNLDVLFRMPELSATGNDGVIFNSGVMAIEPSQCTFRALMSRRKEIVPYNGGDQGFLNEAFVWWHRLPRTVNFKKNFWSNTTKEVEIKDRLFASDPPELYSIHYLGMKPWTCYRDYDCNWDDKDQHVFANDAAHWRWWTVHDRMPERLRRFCGLTRGRKVSLERNRKFAMDERFADGHWKMRISDERRWQSIGAS